MKIPVLGNGQLRVAPNNISTTPLQPGITTQEATAPYRQMAEFGQAVTKAGSDYYKIEEDASRVRVEDALNQLREKQLKLTYDKDEGFTNKLGVNAFEKGEDGSSPAENYGKKLDEGIEEISSKLGNSMQRDLFARHAAEIRTTFNGSLMKHESEQFSNYTLSTREATKKIAQEEIAANYRDDVLVQKSIRDIGASTYDMEVRLKGHSASFAQEVAKDTISSAHILAASSALHDNDPEFAKGYLEKYGPDGAKQISTKDFNSAIETVEKEIDLKVGTRTANKVVTEMMPGDMNAFLSGRSKERIPSLLEVKQKVISELGENVRPERLKVALTEAARFYEDLHKAQKQQADNNYSIAVQALEKNGGRFSALPFSIRNSVSPEDAKKVRDTAQAIALGDNVTNTATYYETSDPAWLATHSRGEIYRRRNDYSKSDFDKILAKKDHIDNPNSKDPSVLNFPALKGMVDKAYAQIGVNARTKNKAEQARIGSTYQMFDELAMQMQQAAGKKLTPVELKKLVDETFLQKGTADGFFYGTNEKRLLSINFGDIPEKDVEDIIQVYQDENGFEPEQNEILNIYRKGEIFKNLKGKK